MYVTCEPLQPHEEVSQRGDVQQRWSDQYTSSACWCRHLHQKAHAYLGTEQQACPGFISDDGIPCTQARAILPEEQCTFSKTEDAVLMALSAEPSHPQLPVMMSFSTWWASMSANAGAQMWDSRAVVLFTTLKRTVVPVPQLKSNLLRTHSARPRGCNTMGW